MIPQDFSANAAESDPNRGSLDEVDRGILRLLQVDGRMAFRQIARELAVSEGTVRSRVRRMEESGALSIIAVADPFRMGYRVLAFCLLRTVPGKHDLVVNTLSKWPETTYVSTCTGEADVYIQLVCVDHDHLWNLLYERVPQIGGVESINTYMELKMHKVAYGYPPNAPYVRS